MNLINLVGKRFGRLLVVEKADSKKVMQGGGVCAIVAKNVLFTVQH